MEEILQVLNTNVFTVKDYTFTVGGLLMVPLFLAAGIWLTRFLATILTQNLIRKGINPDIVHLAKRILYIIALIVLVITTLDLLKVPITAFAFLSGAVAIGFGFGAQNIINNFISGWILMWERPIRIGDFLEVDSARGRVEAINTRSTRIRRVDGVHMLIPNSKLLENTVINWTLVDQLTRTSVVVGVAYGSDCKQVKSLIEQAVKEQQEVLSEPNPAVIFDDFGDNSLKFEAFFWINATVERDLRVIRSNIRFRIDELFKDHGIVIAFPQRDVHLDGTLVLNRSTQKQKG